MSTRRLIVGLGNPGDQYRGTRHNLGFEVVDVLRSRFSASEPTSICGSLVWSGEELLFAQPQTYMNRSGLAVRCLVDEFRLAVTDVLVVYDEVALPLGGLRLKGKGSAAGHRGLESVIYNLQTSHIPRLRLGIGAAPDGAALADFVLAPFDSEERDAVGQLVSAAADACQLWSEAGLERAMNQVNGRSVSDRVCSRQVSEDTND